MLTSCCWDVGQRLRGGMPLRKASRVIALASDEDERARSVDGLGTRPDLRRRPRCGTGTGSGLRNGRGGLGWWNRGSGGGGRQEQRWRRGKVEVAAARAQRKRKRPSFSIIIIPSVFNFFSFLLFYFAKNIKVISCTYCTIIRHVVLPLPSILSPN